MSAELQILTAKTKDLKDATNGIFDVTAVVVADTPILCSIRTTEEIIDIATKYGSEVVEESLDVVRSTGKDLVKETGSISSALEKVVVEHGAIRVAEDDLFKHAKIKRKHIFSPDHKKRGILELGNSEVEILEKFKNIIRNVHSEGLLENGNNQIRTVINGFDVELRVFLRDCKILGFDGFRGYSGRIFKDNLINWRL